LVPKLVVLTEAMFTDAFLFGSTGSTAGTLLTGTKLAPLGG